MSFIQNIFSSRDNNGDGNVYVGQEGRLWFNPITNTIYSSDGNTPGGLPVGAGGNSLPSGPDGALQFSSGALFAGSANLVFSDANGLTVNKATIGNLSMQDGFISTITSANDLTLATFGNSNIHLDTNGFHIHTTSNPEPVFQVTSTGEVKLLTPVFDPLQGALTIVGSSDGVAVAPQLNGVMIHVTGQPGTASRVYNDGTNHYAAYIGRRYNNTPVSPEQVVSSDVVSRIGATPYTDTGWPSISTSRIDFKATENQTASNQGMAIEFWSTASGSNVISKMLSVSNNAMTFYDGTTQATAGIPLSYMANAFGVATLGADSKVLPSQLPAEALVYKGTWNPATNTPFLSDATGQVGWQYSVSADGTHDLGSGPITWYAGDRLNHDGSIWQKLSGTSGVVSLNGRVGAITLLSSDITSALAYTPYDGTVNPNGYVNASIAANGAPVQSVFGREGDVVLQSSDVIAALTANSITSTKIANSFVTIGTTTVELGNSTSSLSGLSSINTLTLAATGNISAANANLGNVVTANYFSGDGSLLSNVSIAGSQTISTWVPILTTSGTGTFTYSIQSGQYIKSGRNVTCYFTIAITNATGVTGTIRISNLPEATLSGSSPVGGGALDNYLFTVLPIHVTGTILPGAGHMDLYWHDRSGSVNTHALMTPTQLGTVATLIGRLSYITAS